MKTLAIFLAFLVGLLLLSWAAFAQGVPNTGFVVAACGSPPSTYQVGQNRPQTLDTGGRNCDTLSGTLAFTVTGSATLPSLGAGSNALYENLFGSLFVQPSFNGTLVDGTHGLPVNIVAGGSTASTFGATFPTTGTAIGVKNGLNMVNLTADGSSNLLVSLATAIPAGANIIGALTANQSINQTQMNGVAVSAGNGTSDTGTQRVTLASNSTGQVAIAAGAASIGTVGLNAGTQIVGKFGIDQTTDITTNGVEIAPTAGSAAGITPTQSAALGSSLVLKGSAGNLYTATISVGATALYLMVFNATSAPIDGAVTPALCYGPLPINAPYALSWAPGPPAVFGTGITLVSSSTGCYSKTASNASFLAGQAK